MEIFSGPYTDILTESVFIGKHRVVEATGYRGMLTYQGESYEELAQRIKET